MKIKENGITLVDDKLKVLIELDDGSFTDVEIDPGTDIGKSDVDIKKEIKDIITTRQVKKDNLTNIKLKLEGKII